MARMSQTTMVFHTCVAPRDSMAVSENSLRVALNLAARAAHHHLGVYRVAELHRRRAHVDAWRVVAGNAGRLQAQVEARVQRVDEREVLPRNGAMGAATAMHEHSVQRGSLRAAQCIGTRAFGRRARVLTMQSWRGTRTRRCSPS
eukprot:980275-Prymnesium_polylepis.3